MDNAHVFLCSVINPEIKGDKQISDWNNTRNEISFGQMEKNIKMFKYFESMDLV